MLRNKFLIGILSLASFYSWGENVECESQWKFKGWDARIKTKSVFETISSDVHQYFRSTVKELERATPATSLNEIENILNKLPHKPKTPKPIFNIHKWYYDLDDVDFRIEAQFYHGCLVGLKITESPKPINIEQVQIFSKKAKDQSNVNK